MIKNNKKWIKDIVENFDKLYFQQIRLMEENNITFEKKDIEQLILSLYFSHDYRNCGNNRALEYYLKFFNMSLKEFFNIESNIFEKYNNENIDSKKLFYFLTNKNINYCVKTSFLKVYKDKITYNQWYDIILSSMKYKELDLIEDFIYKYCDVKNFDFENKENFFNLIILKKIISFEKLNKKESVSYIKKLSNMGFNINDKGISVSPLENAIVEKEKSMLTSIIALKPECDFFVGERHVWDFYLSTYYKSYSLMPHEYNYDVYSYFYKNVPQETLFKSDNVTYVLGRILRKSNWGSVTAELIKKNFDKIYQKEGEFSIRDMIIKNRQLKKRFFELESHLSQEKFNKIAAKKKSGAINQNIEKKVRI